MHDFAQFHIWVSPQMTVREDHRVMDEIETRLHREFPGVEILIHPDPEGHVDSQSDPLRSKDARSEEHTSELQSLMRISYAVFCLKKKKQLHSRYRQTHTKRQHSQS